MNINKNNLFARYYQWIYGNLPNDVCSFFWGSLFAIGLFFILVPGRLMSKSEDTIVPMGFATWLVYIVTLGLGVIIVDGFGYEFTNLWGWLLLGPVIGASVLAALIFTIVGTVYVTTEKLPETTVAQNTKDFVGAVRQKHCTKIHWE